VVMGDMETEEYIYCKDFGVVKKYKKRMVECPIYKKLIPLGYCKVCDYCEGIDKYFVICSHSGRNVLSDDLVKWVELEMRNENRVLKRLDEVAKVIRRYNCKLVDVNLDFSENFVDIRIVFDNGYGKDVKEIGVYFDEFDKLVRDYAEKCNKKGTAICLEKFLFDVLRALIEEVKV